MSDAPASGGTTGSTEPDKQFTVPVPAAPTQAIPVFDPTRELPVADPAWPAPPATGASSPPPPGPPNPYAAQPMWQSAPTAAVDEGVDPLLGQIGVALFWITVGWWLFFLIRILGFLTRNGATNTMLIRTIDRGAEETVVAAVLSVLAALLLLLGRGRAGRSPLGWASLVLAVLTVGVTIWRLVP